MTLPPDLDLVDADRRAGAVVDHVDTEAKRWRTKHRRPPVLTAREALVALQFEALFVWTCAQGIQNGTALSTADLDRLTLAMQRIDSIADEALA